MQHERHYPRMTLLRRLASIVLAVCFVLPLAQCDGKMNEDGKTASADHRISGMDMMSASLHDARAGDVSRSAEIMLAVGTVFFLPLAVWSLSGTTQALVHLAAAPLAGCCLYGWVFAFASRPLFGGILAIACWAALLPMACITLAQLMRQRWNKGRTGAAGA